jgi:hypothetical protein
VQPTALGTAWRTVALKEQGTDLVYGLYAGNDAGTPSVHVNNGSHTMLAGTSSLPLNTWTHVAGVWDGATLRLYVNGTQVRSTPLSGAASQGDQPLYVGGNAVWGEWFQGVIDDVSVWDKALTAAEVLSHAIAAPALPPVPPKKPIDPSTVDLTAAGGGGGGSLTRTATVSDVVAPSRPGKVKVVRRPKGKVVLKWGASKDASGLVRYVVLRGRKVVASSRVAKASVALRRCRGSLVLKVQALDASGNRSRVRAIRVRC